MQKIYNASYEFKVSDNMNKFPNRFSVLEAKQFFYHSSWRKKDKKYQK